MDDFTRSLRTKSKTELSFDFDPIRLELYRNLLTSIAEEMGVSLCRSAFSANIKERRDFSCAIFDQQGNMVAQAAHIPVHLGAMPLSVQSAIQQIQMLPGDTVLLNDPYAGGTHLPDFTLVSPVYIEGALAFFVANRAHHADVGGMTPGSMPLSTHIVQEGIRIPPVKLIRQGEMDHDLLSIVLANVRTPVERGGDLEAQIAANHIGRQRLVEISEKYGVDEVGQYMSALQDYSERIIRKTLQQIPNGRYAETDFLDNDGITDQAIPISVTVTIEDASAIIDFSGSAPQVEGSVNAVYAITLSAVFYVFRSLVQQQIPTNSGCLRPVKVIAPPNTVVNAQFPAAVAGGNVETSQRIVDVVLRALSNACPDLIPAASSGTMNNLTIGGRSGHQDFAYYETIGGGMGARPDRDGISAIQTHMTNTLNTPIEAIETTYPMQIEQYAIRRNSGGQGKTCGGDGIIRSFRLLSPAQVTVLSERRKYPPYGLGGGWPGKCGKNTLFREGKQINLEGKFSIHGQAEDIFQIETPGGGGHSVPEEER